MACAILYTVERGLCGIRYVLSVGCGTAVVCAVAVADCIRRAGSNGDRRMRKSLRYVPYGKSCAVAVPTVRRLRYCMLSTRYFLRYRERVPVTCCVPHFLPPPVPDYLTP